MSALVRYDEERLMKVLLAPVISEKATMLEERGGQFIFRVTPDATKLEIKAAIEMLFKVVVDSVQIVNRRGKVKRAGKSNGRRIHTRRAFICLKSGQKINFSEGVDNGAS